MSQSDHKVDPATRDVFYNYFYNYTVPVDEGLRRHRVYYSHPLSPANRQVRRVQQLIDNQYREKRALKANQEKAVFQRELQEWKNSFGDRCPNYYAKQY